jgi:hypothetical protein
MPGIQACSIAPDLFGVALYPETGSGHGSADALFDHPESAVEIWLADFSSMRSSNG